jgi:hypothetical protein
MHVPRISTVRVPRQAEERVHATVAEVCGGRKGGGAGGSRVGV